VGLLTGQSAHLTAVISAAGRVLRVPPGQVHAVMAQEADPCELILRACLLGRSRLTRHGPGLVVIRSRDDPRTLHLLETLARKRLSSTWLELEASAETRDVIRD
jgi:hypothetical protein